MECWECNGSLIKLLHHANTPLCFARAVIGGLKTPNDFASKTAAPCLTLLAKPLYLKRLSLNQRSVPWTRKILKKSKSSSI